MFLALHQRKHEADLTTDDVKDHSPSKTAQVIPTCVTMATNFAVRFEVMVKECRKGGGIGRGGGGGGGGDGAAVHRPKGRRPTTLYDRCYVIHALTHAPKPLLASYES
ncbi:hypothetical protein M0804_010913 [Polistes exclamans]|nr:hypothetical protein M0804_010913 [Polistes exclamans]